ncbi:MAG TPA: type II toxin-antitoxin system HicB family antitoxin [Ktedonobacterales bacterium]|jgi:predicted RNase H-like HicB family nuclease
MFAEYLQAAMQHAVYEQIEDGSYFGEVPEFSGAWANGATPEACAKVLESVIEGWILLAIADREELPEIDGHKLVAKASV